MSDQEKVRVVSSLCLLNTDQDIAVRRVTPQLWGVV